MFYFNLKFVGPDKLDSFKNPYYETMQRNEAENEIKKHYIIEESH